MNPAMYTLNGILIQHEILEKTYISKIITTDWHHPILRKISTIISSFSALPILQCDLNDAFRHPVSWFIYLSNP